MNVLFLCMRMVIEVNEHNKKHTTGYSYMVRDIAEYLVKEGVSVDLLAITDKRGAAEYKGVRVLPRTWKDMLLNFRPYYIVKALKIIKKYRPSFNVSLHVLYYYLFGGYIEKCIKNGKYDLVHIQGFDYGALPYIDCCERLGGRFTITFHALTSFSDALKVPEPRKNLEKNFLRYAWEQGIPITTISTGMMNHIKRFLEINLLPPNFRVITNGTNISPRHNEAINIKDKYAIPKEKKIALCVGNLCQRKNQAQIVRSVANLPQVVRKQLFILFLGEDRLDSQLNAEINKLNLHDCCAVCGNVPEELIGSYYSQADYTLLASVSEGFGLTIIEGFVYGLPNLTFDDLEAIPDLYDDNVMITIKYRTDEAFADGIVQLLDKKWNKEYIRQYAESFSLEKMARKYMATYEIVTNQRSIRDITDECK